MDALSRRLDLKDKDRKEPNKALFKIMPDGSLKYNLPEQAIIAKVAE